MYLRNCIFFLSQFIFYICLFIHIKFFKYILYQYWNFLKRPIIIITYKINRSLIRFIIRNRSLTALIILLYLSPWFVIITIFFDKF